MVTFLERYILPSLSAGLSVESDVDAGGIANVWSVPLKLSEKDLETVRPDNIDDFFNELLEASDLPAQGLLSRLSVLVIGTSKRDRYRAFKRRCDSKAIEVCFYPTLNCHRKASRDFIAI